MGFEENLGHRHVQGVSKTAFTMMLIRCIFKLLDPSEMNENDHFFLRLNLLSRAVQCTGVRCTHRLRAQREAVMLANIKDRNCRREKNRGSKAGQ